MATDSPEQTNGATRLLEAFSPPTYEQWREVTEQSLKGASFEKKLITRTYEGIDLQPMYFRADGDKLTHTDTLPGAAPYLRANHALGYVVEPWHVSQETPLATPTELNDVLRWDLERGQTAISLVLDEAARHGHDPDTAEAGQVGRSGTSIASVDDIVTALKQINLAQFPVAIQPGAMWLPLAGLIGAAYEQLGSSAAHWRGAIDVDPLGLLASTGQLPLSLEDAYTDMANLTTWANTNAPQLATIAVSSLPYNNAGASAVEELAFALATAVAYIRAMQTRDVPIDTFAQHVRFTYGVGANFFMEVAKLRAARLLWANVVEAFGGAAESQKMNLHVRTTSWNKTSYDPFVNMLRTTTEAFSGVMGGCNSMHVGFYDETLRRPDDLSRRVARNTQIILQQECHFLRLVDPAGGSWYIETLTDTLARKAWALFQEIEGQGGMFAALQAGSPQQKVAAVAKKRSDNLTSRRDVLVGTNQYPNLTEKPIPPEQIDYASLQATRAQVCASQRASRDQAACTAALDQLQQARTTTNVTPVAIQAALSGATLGELASNVVADRGSESITPVQIYRLAESFEQLRGRAEASGERPKVFLANMGPIIQHKARADFSTGFLAVGGFDVLTNTGFATVDEAAKAAIDSSAPVVVICSTDDTYPELVPALTQQIKAAQPATQVLLAGYPAEHVESFKAAGIDEFIHLRANLYDVLLGLQQKLGMA
ncbi:MAG: methylmalonyl-CoA mutase [Chloroflexaceae bacterium]|nr:methylmalonyl-CoA mutase [Chloroflexaceae bacterium]